MEEVFNKNPSTFVDMNDLFAVLNDKVGLTSEQWKKAIENTNYLYNNLGLADISVGSVNTVFLEPGTLGDVVVTHREDVVGGKTHDFLDYTFYMPSPRIETTMTSTTTTDASAVGVGVTSAPIVEVYDGQEVVVGYTFAFNARSHIVDISGKEDLANKVAQITEQNKASEVAYPSVKAVTDYVDSAVGAIDAWLQNLYDGEGV